ncbi:ASCH domain-containing protein [Rhizobium anhuiense]|uniref:ASCH domain-containing protein n=1 Tax=Rhizobium anhuiense TaxID=1184720 RepID=UPI0020CBDB8B|nr:ASCH domain-containing protein [Rhizobium anhuiense]UTS88161.1 ASCH domain-containing protein [Rhizobium anhuiense bv. trifolii]
MKVLLSIKPEFAEKIFEGTKRYEFRKSMFRDKAVRTVVVYVTRPVGQIIGEFDIDEILCEQPERLWQLTKSHSGITREFFDSYFSGRSTSFALVVGATRRYHPPIDPAVFFDNFTPPQSYMYVDDELGRPSVEQLQMAG